MSDIIPNIFHFINETSYLEDYKYFSILSAFEINRAEKIFLHYYYLPSGKLFNKLKEKISDKLILVKINIPIIFKNNFNMFFLKFRLLFIYQILKKYGGIYLNINTISINPLTELLKYNFFKSENNEIIGSEINSYMVNKYIDYYYLPNTNDKLFDEPFGIRNINNNFINNYIIDDLKYNDDENFIYKIIFNEIHDYSFGEYFHLIKNCYFLHLNCKEELLNNINTEYIFNKISIYTLLVRNAIVYNFINNVEPISLHSNNIELINYIDIILWINLDSSTDRKHNMMKLLNKFDVANHRVKAVDGNKIQNINSKYFYSETNIYPKYTNKEYAVLLSHLNAIELYSTKYRIGLVCEDDLSTDFLKYWNKDIKNIISGAPSDWDIIMLGYFSLNINFANLYKKWDSEWSAISYLVNYSNIRGKIKNLKHNGKWKCNETDLMVSDNYIFSKFTTYVYKYPLFTFPNDNDSTFHGDHVNYHRVYKISNYLVHENIYNEYLS